MNNKECCTFDCNQGRNCPKRTERRREQSLWRAFLMMFGLSKERRSGFDRRQRVEKGPIPDTGRTMYGMPIIIDDAVPEGVAEFRSGRRVVQAEIVRDSHQVYTKEPQ